MLGVLVNVIMVIIGSIIGMIFKKSISKKATNTIMTGLGVCVLYIGITGSLCGKNVLILIISIVLGAITGTLLDIDENINKFALKIERKFKDEKNSITVSEGFVSATLLFCIGSMTVTGSFQAGLSGDNSILITKAMLDFVSSMMLASTLGIGVTLSSVSILVIQGALVLLARFVSPFLSMDAINEMTCAGSLLIVMIGTNMMSITKIKVADFLPSILYAPVIYNVFEFINEFI